MHTHATKKLGYILFHLASVALLFFILLLLPQENFYPFIIFLAVAGISRSQYLVSKSIGFILTVEPGEVYKYYGETDNGNIILSRLTASGKYEDGIYTSKKVEWFDDPIYGSTYIYGKSTKDRYLLFLHNPEEMIQQDKKY